MISVIKKLREVINKLPRPLINPRNPIHISTFNTRTASSNWKLYELTNYCILHSISILAIQEHRRHFDSKQDSIQRLHVGMGWWFIYTSASEAGVGGVGFLLSPSAYKNLCSINSISDRILQLKLGNNSDLKSCVYCVYSPTSCSKSCDIKLFYTELKTSVDTIPPAHMLIVMGDLNAQLLPNSLTPHSSNTKENRNTSYLNEFMDSCSLKAANTLFTKSTNNLNTFYGPNQRTVTLDYILVRSKWVRSVRDCSAKFPPISSDHNMLVLALKWTLKSNTPAAPTRQDHSMLLSDPTTAKAFCGDVVDNFEWREEDGPANYTRIVDLIKSSLNDNVPKLTYAKRPVPWAEPDIHSLRSRYQSSRLRMQSQPTPDNKATVSTFALELSRLYVAKQEQYINSICVDILQHTGDNQAKKAWDAVNLLTNRRARTTGLIPAQDDNDRLQQWYKHFSKLLSPPVKPVRSDLQLPKVFNGLRFESGMITKKEVADAIKDMKNNKASGADGISAEILKCADLLDLAWRYLFYCYNSKTVPAEWHTSVIVPVFKKGDSSICNNYRGIALMSVYAKLYNRILFVRLRNTLEKHLRPNQNGFRPLRSTSQQVLALRRLIEEINSTRDGKLAAIFIDFSKAFDSVDWNYIENILLAYDVPKALVDAIMSLYYGAQASVKVGSSLSESFDLGVGVLQGDTKPSPGRPSPASIAYGSPQLSFVRSSSTSSQPLSSPSCSTMPPPGRWIKH